MGPGRLVTERGGVQARIQHHSRAGPGPGHLARQRHGLSAGSGELAAVQAALAQPRRHARQHRLKPWGEQALRGRRCEQMSCSPESGKKAG